MLKSIIGATKNALQRRKRRKAERQKLKELVTALIDNGIIYRR